MSQPHIHWRWFSLVSQKVCSEIGYLLPVSETGSIAHFLLPFLSSLSHSLRIPLASWTSGPKSLSQALLSEESKLRQSLMVFLDTVYGSNLM